MKNISTKPKLEKIELSIRIVAYLTAGIWAIYVFVFQNLTVPSLEPTKSNFRIQFQKIGSDDSVLYYSLKFSLKNESNIVEKFPAAYFNILAYKIVKKNTYKPKILNEVFTEDFNYDKYDSIDTTNDEYISSGRILQDNYELTPLKEVNEEYFITFPKNKFSGIQIEVRTIQCKENANVCAKWKVNDSTKRIHAGLFKINHKFLSSKLDTNLIKNDENNFLKSNSIYFFNEYYSYFVGNLK